MKTLVHCPNAWIEYLVEGAWVKRVKALDEPEAWRVCGDFAIADPSYVGCDVTANGETIATLHGESYFAGPQQSMDALADVQIVILPLDANGVAGRQIEMVAFRPQSV